MAIGFNTAKKNALANTSVASITILRIYDGTRPASADTAISTQVLLAEITGITWGSASGGVVSLSGAPFSDASANNTGTATWGRFSDAGDTLRIDGSVGSDFTLANPSIVAGGTVTLTSASVTQP